MKKIINVIKKPGFIVFGVIALTFIFMRLDIIPLMNRVKKTFLSKDYYVYDFIYSRHPEKFSDPNVNYIIYYENDDEYVNIDWRFNRSANSRGSSSEINISLQINPVLTFHNFFDGYVWFGYEVHYYDKNGTDIGGSISRWPYLAKMKIHRVGLTWQVMDVDEHP